MAKSSPKLGGWRHLPQECAIKKCVIGSFFKGSSQFLQISVEFDKASLDMQIAKKNSS